MTTNRLHQNDDHEPNGDAKHADQEETRQARLTAFALGQLDAAELAAVEAELADNTQLGVQLRQDVEQTSRLADVIKEAATIKTDDAASSTLDEKLRTAIENRLSELEAAEQDPSEQVERPAKAISSRRVVFALATAICLLLLAAPLVGPAIFGSLEKDKLHTARLDDGLSSKETDKLAVVPTGDGKDFLEEESRSLAYDDTTAPLALRPREAAQQPGDLEKKLGPNSRVTSEQEMIMNDSLGSGLDIADAAAKERGSTQLFTKDPSGSKNSQAGDTTTLKVQPGSGRKATAYQLTAPSEGDARTGKLLEKGPKPQSSFGLTGKPADARYDKNASGQQDNYNYAPPTNQPAARAGRPAASRQLGTRVYSVEDLTRYKTRLAGQQSPDAYGTGMGSGGLGMESMGMEGGQGGIPGSVPELRLLVEPKVIAKRERELTRARGWFGLYDRNVQTDLASLVPNYLAEQYEPIVENRFLGVYDNPLSTFSIDVDTASYANVRRFLGQGQLPPPNAVRIEEMLNYFSYDYKPPTGETPFAVHLESADCPWQPSHRLVRIGLKGKVISRKERPACNLVFLLDVSGSMSDEDKLPLLKRAMKMLADELGENDRVSIVTYAGNAGLALDSTSGDQHKKIRTAIEQLHSGGSTNGSAGIQLAYQKAAESFLEEGANRVILATDGDLNVGVTSDDALVRMIKSKASSGVFLSVLGFGTGNLKDSKLEKLADNGNGAYSYIDSLSEARKVLVEQITGSLVTIAKDVKIQVEFNPAEVKAYRLIGYENRMLQTRDFKDDKKDAGEIGAGHTVTALFELVPVNADVTPVALVEGQPLKYQRTPKPPVKKKTVADDRLTEAAATGELVSVRLRYKEPTGTKSKLVERSLKKGKNSFGQASTDFRFAASVAAFGMVLRGSEHRGSSTLSMVEEIAVSSLGEDSKGYRTEMVDLVRKAHQLGR